MKTKLLSLPEAMLVYNKMLNYLKIPSINPNYIKCDSKRDKNIELNFGMLKKVQIFSYIRFIKILSKNSIFLILNHLTVMEVQYLIAKKNNL